MRASLKRYAAACCLAGVLTLSASTSPYAQDSTEYNLKAAYIYNFIKFIKWPAGFDTEARSAIDICIVGDSDLMQAQNVFKKASTPKLAISLVKENNPANISNHCHVAFIGNMDAAKVKYILAGLRGKHVLTVSDVDGFVENGGMIEFVLQDDKIKFVINPEPSEISQLNIDARLLETAAKVIGR